MRIHRILENVVETLKMFTKDSECWRYINNVVIAVLKILMQDLNILNLHLESCLNITKCIYTKTKLSSYWKVLPKYEGLLTFLNLERRCIRAFKFMKILRKFQIILQQKRPLSLRVSPPSTNWQFKYSCFVETSHLKNGLKN